MSLLRRYGNILAEKGGEDMPKSDKELTAEIAAAVIRAYPEHRSGPLKLDQVDEIIREVYSTVRSLEDET